MFYFTWDASLETGIDVIDTQHRRIVDYINQLHDAVNTRNNALIGMVLKDLTDYTVTHFSFEEQLQEQAGYESIAEHKKVHDSFTGRIIEYNRRFEAGEDIGKKLLSDLRIWLTNHIQLDDGDYAATVRAYLNGEHDRGWLSKTLHRMFGSAA